MCARVCNRDFENVQIVCLRRLVEAHKILRLLSSTPRPVGDVERVLRTGHCLLTGVWWTLVTYTIMNSFPNTNTKTNTSTEHSHCTVRSSAHPSVLPGGDDITGVLPRGWWRGAAPATDCPRPLEQCNGDAWWTCAWRTDCSSSGWYSRRVRSLQTLQRAATGARGHGGVPLCSLRSIQQHEARCAGE